MVNKYKRWAWDIREAASSEHLCEAKGFESQIKSGSSALHLEASTGGQQLDQSNNKHNHYVS